MMDPYIENKTVKFGITAVGGFSSAFFVCIYFLQRNFFSKTNLLLALLIFLASEVIAAVENRFMGLRLGLMDLRQKLSTFLITSLMTAPHVNWLRLGI